MPLQNELILLHPQNAVLRFGSEKSIDVGALCYQQRSDRKRKGPKKTLSRYVVEESLSPTRVEQIRKLVLHLSDFAAQHNFKKITLANYTSSFVRFIDWCDDNNHYGVLEDSSQARMAFSGYVKDLREKLRKYEYKSQGLADYQKAVLTILSDYHSIDDLHVGVNLVRRENDKQPTVPPDENDISKVIGLCKAVFEGFIDLALNNKPFPYKLRLPNNNINGNDYMWVFPCPKWFMRHDEIINRHSLKLSHWAYDFVNGCVANFDDIVEFYTSRKAADLAIRSAEKSIISANTDSRNLYRLERGMLAQQVFYIMFIANTGMNLEQARTLPWSDDYVVNVERQAFRSIKYRAKGRMVSFEIESIFLKEFKRFLELRKYLLNGRACDILFFTFNRDFSSPPSIISRDKVSNIFFKLRHIDPSIPTINPREWRAKKADWLINNTDVSTTSMLLNNSEETVLKSYIEGSHTKAITEFSEFFEKLSHVATSVVVEQGNKSDINLVEITVGECRKQHSPTPITENPPITPDCRQSDGCLFCNEYVVHADEKDIRKLVSFGYYINQTSSLSSSIEHFDRLLGPVLDRIQFILNEIKASSKQCEETISKVMREVEEEELLDSFWGNKLKMLIELGVVV
jgi:hypothetical protein